MAERKIDCMDEICPIPLLKASKEIPGMNKGEILILETNHNCSIVNVVEWAKKKGHHVDYLEVDDGVWEIYIEKV